MTSGIENLKASSKNSSRKKNKGKKYIILTAKFEASESGLYGQLREIWHFQMVIHVILNKSAILLYHPLEMPVSFHQL